MAQARRTSMRRPLRAQQIEAMACAIYEVEYPTYSETACVDHNRWSWQGDGNPQEFKDRFRAYAEAALGALERWNI